jgi:hypothetical protein
MHLHHDLPSAKTLKKAKEEVEDDVDWLARADSYMQFAAGLSLF